MLPRELLRTHLRQSRGSPLLHLAEAPLCFPKYEDSPLVRLRCEVHLANGWGWLRARALVRWAHFGCVPASDEASSARQGSALRRCIAAFKPCPASRTETVGERAMTLPGHCVDLVV